MGREVRAAMDAYDVTGAGRRIKGFVDDLSNWYVRRSRRRFWNPGGGGGEDSLAAFHTLYDCLVTTTALLAPLVPFVTEELWSNLTAGRGGRPDSVHLADYPEVHEAAIDPGLDESMALARRIVELGRRIRTESKTRTRQPLSGALVHRSGPRGGLDRLVETIADELNVKAVELTDDIDAYGRFDLTVNAKVAGPRLGKDVQAAIKAVKAGEAVVNADGTLTAGPALLQQQEYSSRLVAADPEYTSALPDGAGLVVLDGTVTEELEAEGWARDLIRELQDLRKSTGLDVSDRIRVTIAVPSDREQWARTHADLIAGEIRATTFEFGEPVDGAEIGDGVRVAIEKA